MKKLLLCLSVFIGFALTAAGQANQNSDCSSAYRICASFHLSDFNIGNSTSGQGATGGLPGGTCINEGRSVWFYTEGYLTGGSASFELSGIDNSCGMEMAVFSGSCGALTEIDCGSVGAGGTLTLNIPNTTAGERYHIIVNTPPSCSGESFTLKASTTDDGIMGAPEEDLTLRQPTGSVQCGADTAQWIVENTTTEHGGTIQYYWDLSGGIHTRLGQISGFTEDTETSPGDRDTLLFPPGCQDYDAKLKACNECYTDIGAGVPDLCDQLPENITTDIQTLTLVKVEPVVDTLGSGCVGSPIDFTVAANPSSSPFFTQVEKFTLNVYESCDTTIYLLGELDLYKSNGCIELPCTISTAPTTIIWDTIIQNPSALNNGGLDTIFNYVPCSDTLILFLDLDDACSSPTEPCPDTIRQTYILLPELELTTDTSRICEPEDPQVCINVVGPAGVTGFIYDWGALGSDTTAEGIPATNCQTATTTGGVPGTYNFPVTVYDDRGCQKDTFAVAIVDPKPRIFADTLTPQKFSCRMPGDDPATWVEPFGGYCPDDTVTYRDSIYFGTPPYTITYSPAVTILSRTTVNAAGDIVDTFQAPAGATITITVVDSNNCDTTWTVGSLILPPPPIPDTTLCESADLSAVQMYVDTCFGDQSIDTSTWEVDGGNFPFTYNDADGDGTFEYDTIYVDMTGAAPGTYPVNVEIVDAAGCTQQASGNIIIIPFAPTFAFSPSAICESDLPQTATGTVSNITTDTRVDWIDVPGGCVSNDGDLSDASENFDFSAACAAGNYNFTVAVTDTVTGCTDTLSASVFISRPQIVADTLTPDTSNCRMNDGYCPGDIVQYRDTISGGVAPYSITYSAGTIVSNASGDNPGDTVQVFEAPAGTPVTITVTDAAGCTLTYSVGSQVLPPPTMNNVTRCNDEDRSAVPFEVNICGTDDVLGTTWDAQGYPITIINADSSEVEIDFSTAMAGSTTTVSVDVLDEGGCTHTVSATFSVVDFAPYLIADPTGLCNSPGQSTSQICVQGLSNNSTFDWITTPGGANCFTSSGFDPTAQCNTFDFIGCADGAYTFEVGITDQVTGCDDTLTYDFIITNQPEVDATASQTTICEGESVIITGSGGATYGWSSTPSTTINCTTAPCEEIIVTPMPVGGQITTYTFIDTGYVGNCSDTGLVQVTVIPDNITTSPDVDTSLCEGETLDLSFVTFAGAQNILWSDNGAGGQFDPSNTAANPTYVPPAGFTGLIILQVDLSNSCGSTDGIVVRLTVNPIPTVNVTASTANICAGNPVTLTATQTGGTTTFSWSDSDGNVYTPSPDDLLTVFPENTTTYYASVSNANCTGVDSVTVNVSPNPEPQINADFISGECYPVDVIFDFTVPSAPPSPATVTWNLGDTILVNPGRPFTHTYGVEPDSTYPVVYNITLDVDYDNGCSRADTFSIEVCEDFFIPNTFTPNGDGENDFFMVRGLDGQTCDLVVFNRWGEKIFEESPYNNDWDGVGLNGKELGSDVYYYVLKCDDGSARTGWIQIIRNN